MNLSEMTSRVRVHSAGTLRSEFLARENTDLTVAGRHVLTLWKVLRGTMALKAYTLENVAIQVLDMRSVRLVCRGLPN
jgi:hypothetical protein